VKVGMVLHLSRVFDVRDVAHDVRNGRREVTEEFDERCPDGGNDYVKLTTIGCS
jgi:hypothetical protein